VKTRLYEAGELTVAQIAAEFGVTRPTHRERHQPEPVAMAARRDLVTASPTTIC